MAAPAGDLYRGLASLLRAGVAPREAIRSLRANGTLSEPWATPVAAAAERGAPVAETLAPVASPEERAILEAAEATGRLDVNLDRLAQLRERRASLQRSLLTDLWYPILLFHAAALILPVVPAFQKSRSFFGADWLIGVLAILAPVYLLVGLRFLLVRTPEGRRRERRFLEFLPGFGNAARHRRRAEFAGVLAAAYEAGISLETGLRMAGRVSGEGEAEAAARVVASGRSLGEAVKGLVEEADQARISTAEMAGELTAALESLAAGHAEAAAEIQRRAVLTLSRIVTIGVMAWIAFTIVGRMLDIYRPYL